MHSPWQVSLIIAAFATFIHCEDSAGELVDAESSTITSEAIPDEKLQQLFEMMDTNDDGKASMPEIMAFGHEARKFRAVKDATAMLKDYDADQDGKLQLEELLGSEDEYREEVEAQEKADEESVHRRDMEVSWFKASDRNKDGSLDADEIPSLLYSALHDDVLTLTTEVMLKSQDADGNGEVSQQEFGGDVVSDDDFASLDSDGSGGLNLAELKNWESSNHQTEKDMKFLLSKGDLDHDGHLSFDELKAAEHDLEAHHHLLEWAQHYEL